LMCAKRISTHFRSSPDLAIAFVFLFRLATSRAFSCRSRAIFLDGSFGQHRHLSEQASRALSKLKSDREDVPS
jgi:hypothetical protein